MTTPKQKCNTPAFPDTFEPAAVLQKHGFHENSVQISDILKERLGDLFKEFSRNAPNVQQIYGPACAFNMIQACIQQDRLSEEDAVSVITSIYSIMGQYVSKAQQQLAEHAQATHEGSR